MSFTRRDFLRAAVTTISSWQAGLASTTTSGLIGSLLPRTEEGHQFVVYGDSCSGRPGRSNEQNLKAVNQLISRLSPFPEFICFTGDNIQGMVKDADELRRQWEYFLGTEMAWLDRRRTPLYSTTSNHNTYGALSERVWREVCSDLPQNGPETQKGLSYYIRRGNLLLVCVNTNFSGFAEETKATGVTPGHGRIEHEWLDRVLNENADATHKFVAGHVPAFPVNGYARYPLWRIVPHEAAAFWVV